MVKCLPTVRGTRVQFLGQEGLLEKGMAIHIHNCIQKALDILPKLRSEVSLFMTIFRYTLND